MNTFIEHQNWRYATKKFDSSKKVTAADLEILKEAIRLSASSYGLQLYKVLIIEDAALKAKLLPASFGQTQVVDASHLIVFANQTNVGDTEIDAYLENTSATRELPIEALAGYGSFMKNTINPMPEDLKNIWTSKQTYIAMANLLHAAAELKIDSTPMEGFNAAQFNEILGLDALNLNASVIVPIGYRHEEDETQHYKKVRKAPQDLFITL
ncbi:NAD(P)H-dependent oxidoreductase [Flavobacterium sp.]|uniref:NAD(P)H-dependent oxidoreductase n=1 Tax=Flavobacterium sp. TaxID=239 RepID=UPI002608CF66|nr:NAD(P)H-dependent oxidoreductase [Flavobacterium sp.]MDG2433040.1 NAD(P)H-dependent oxidoreductase [Flavobacterium sp.]